MKRKIIIPILFAISLCACKKDAQLLRSTQYTLTAQNGSNLQGTVTFVEIKDSARTEVDLAFQNAILTGYVVHIHQGPPTAYHIILYDFGIVYPQAGKVNAKVYLPLPYDSAMTLNGTFVAHDSAESYIVGSCGVGKNR